MWVAPGFGQLREGDPDPNDNLDTSRYFWNQSPIIAKARYQATADYVWAFDVNVVRIILGNATLDPAGGQAPALTAGVDAFGNNIVQAHSRTGGPKALQSSYIIESMEGPTRGIAEERGVEDMMVGYIQLLAATSYNASYAGDFTFENRMQGDVYVDSIATIDPTGVTVLPWYDSGNLTSQFIAGDGLLTGVKYLANEDINATSQIAMSDSPFPFFQMRNPLPNFTGALQTATFQWDFQLIVAVGTRDVTSEDHPNPPGDRYPFFRRAVAEWQFEGAIARTGAQLYDIALASPGVEIVSGWAEENLGTLAFDSQVVRGGDENGTPVVANDILNAPTTYPPPNNSVLGIWDPVTQ